MNLSFKEIRLTLLTLLLTYPRRVESGEILAQHPQMWLGGPEGQNLEALVALCG
jgi:hypothetical protein